MNTKQIEELLLQSLEHEIGGVQVYATALECVRNDDLKKEWQKYHAQTQRHVEVLTDTCKGLGIDPKRETPGRKVVRHTGAALVAAMKMAKAEGDPAGAELVACECVVLAETKDHADWELIGKASDHAPADIAAKLKAAYDQIEDEEDEHLYHSRGWCRELRIASLGITAVLPPPEEQRKVKTAMGAAMAEQSAEKVR